VTSQSCEQQAVEVVHAAPSGAQLLVPMHTPDSQAPAQQSDERVHDMAVARHPAWHTSEPASSAQIPVQHSSGLVHAEPVGKHAPVARMLTQRSTGPSPVARHSMRADAPPGQHSRVAPGRWQISPSSAQPVVVAQRPTFAVGSSMHAPAAAPQQSPSAWQSSPPTRQPPSG
jgi:hypothetical protein